MCIRDSSTCTWHPILTATFPYFRFWNGLPGMTCFRFYIPFSRWKHIFLNSGLKNSFWIPPMMLMLSMNTVVGKRSRLLSTWAPVIPDTSLIRMISQSTMMAFLSVSWAYACIKMVMKLLNTGRNTGVQRLTGNVAVSVNIPVRQQNTAEPVSYTHLDVYKRQGFSRYSTLSSCIARLA